MRYHAPILQADDKKDAAVAPECDEMGDAGHNERTLAADEQVRRLMLMHALPDFFLPLM
jgi:hypothetical protein